MTGEIQYTRPKCLLHMFPENQEHQRSLSMCFLVLNIIILVWKQKNILLPPFGWDFSCPMHFLGCVKTCCSLRILHNLISRTTIVMIGTFIQIHFLHAPPTKDHCLLARVSYRQSMSIGLPVSHTITVTMEVQSNLLARAPLSSGTHTPAASLLLRADWIIIYHFFDIHNSTSYLLGILLRRLLGF